MSSIEELFEVPGYGKSSGGLPVTVAEKVHVVGDVWWRFREKNKQAVARKALEPLCQKYKKQMAVNPPQMISQWPKWLKAQVMEKNLEVLVLCLKENMKLPQSCIDHLKQLQAANDATLAGFLQQYSVTLPA